MILLSCAKRLLHPKKTGDVTGNKEIRLNCYEVGVAAVSLALAQCACGGNHIVVCSSLAVYFCFSYSTTCRTISAAGSGCWVGYGVRFFWLVGWLDVLLLWIYTEWVGGGGWGGV